MAITIAGRQSTTYLLLSHQLICPRCRRHVLSKAPWPIHIVLAPAITTPVGILSTMSFRFRANGEAPAYPSRLETDRIDGDSRAAQRNRRPYRGRGGGRGARILTAERPLLQLHRGEVSQKVLGSAGDPTATQKFSLRGTSPIAAMSQWMSLVPIMILHFVR